MAKARFGAQNYVWKYCSSSLVLADKKKKKRENGGSARRTANMVLFYTKGSLDWTEYNTGVGGGRFSGQWIGVTVQSRSLVNFSP